MEKFISIQQKLQRNVMLLITITLTAVILIITILNIVSLNANINKTKASIEKALITKGRLLAANNSLAMRGMAADNSFTMIQDLVAAALKDDRDIVYAIFMDPARKPWAIANQEQPSGKVENKEPLTDSIALWASNLTEVGSKQYAKQNKKVKEVIIEFAGPVIADDETLGFIRYGISTATMVATIEMARRGGIKSGIFMILFLIAIGAVSLYTSSTVLKRLSQRITKPIGSLVKSTEVIGQGNYNVEVKPESNDEIGNLAQYFESMRVTIKRYTEHLQDIIDEKMQQVNDILNNIDQGLFTINFDGKVNPEYSRRANDILKVKDISKHNIQEIFRLDQKQERLFSSWLTLVMEKHESQRWKKIVRLSPVQQIELMEAGAVEPKFIEFDYQRILDKNNKLSKLMILSRDVTEERRREMELKEQRLRHENEMKTVLGIVNTPPEEMKEFVEDTDGRLKVLTVALNRHLAGVEKMRQEYPQGAPYTIKKEHIDELYRDIHTIKGNAGSYGFDLMSAIAHTLEDDLDKLREPAETRRDQTIHEMLEKIEKQKNLLDEIRKKMGQFFGEGEDLSVKVPLTRIQAIDEKAKKIAAQKVEPEVRQVLEECSKLTWKHLKDITRKYQKIVQKAGRKLGKEVEFSVEPEKLLLSPDEFAAIDEALVHLTRNAVDHGIEPPEVRAEAGKEVKGHVKISYASRQGMKVLTIADDGGGIDGNRIAAKAVEKGFITAQKASTMSEQEKVNLIYLAGFSTTDKVTDVSGRGFGMDIVNKSLAAIGAALTIGTKLGQGTEFTIAIPDPSQPRK
jgi:two-component system, chemotaxis family, sensor kinase CheA